MNSDSRPVRFICTDAGQHKRKSGGGLPILRLTGREGGVEHFVSGSTTSAPFGRTGPEQLKRQWRNEDGRGSLPDFDIICPKCGRNARVTAVKMRSGIDKLLSAFPVGESAFQVDISQPEFATIFE